MHRVLKDTGSIYLHCDPTMSHSLKLLMDSIFGKKNFRNELVWYYTNGGGRATKWFNRKHDIILAYAKNLPSCFYNGLSIGDKRTIDEGTFSGYFKTDASGRRYQEVRASGKIYKYYVDDPKNPDDVWQINVISQRDKTERTGYPTQKPLSLLERRIKASSNEEDMVLDPFCGCATACVAAERLGRHWIGIDLSDKSVDLIRERLKVEENLWRQIGEGALIIPRDDLPERTDIGAIITDMRGHKKTLYGECGGDCQGCKEHFKIQHLEIDHKTPRSMGGTDTKGNLHLLCGNCNRIKGNRSQEYLIARLKELGRT